MYYTGIATSWADLRTAIFTACTANGWALTDDVLSKGAAFVRLTVSNTTSGTGAGAGIISQGATGYSAGALVAPSPMRPRLGKKAWASTQPTFPIEYYLHVFTGPDEVFIVIKSDVSYFHYMAFGLSTVSGLGGTGLWLSASASYSSNVGAAGVYIGEQGSGSAIGSGAFLWDTGTGTPNIDFNVCNTIHLGIDSVVWANATGLNAINDFSAVSAAAPMMRYSPNGWNGASPLIRIRGLLARASSKSSLICDIQAARYVRIDNFSPGEIITLGAEHWVIYPFYRKDAINRDGGNINATTHSGTMGWAIRYDGP